MYGFRYPYGSNEWEGVVLFINFKNEFWSIKVKQNSSGRRYEGGWKKISGGSSQINPSDMIKYFQKPEHEGYVANANTLMTSGIYKTKDGDDKTIGLPDVDKKWGILQNFMENTTSEQSRAGFQLYSPIDGNGKGKLFIRLYGGGVQPADAQWITLDIPKLASLNESYFNTPEEADTIPSVTGQLETGYYKTTESTTGMEGVPVGRRDGIVKIIKDGDVSVQEYSPSIAGDDGYFTRTIPVVQTTRTEINWQEWKKDNHGRIKIFDSRDATIHNPLNFRNQVDQDAGFIRHDWMFTSAQGINLPSIEAGKRCMLSTYVPDSKNAGTSSSDFSDIFQIAYVTDGNVFKRHGKKSEDGWENWNQISSGSGGSSPATFDINNELTNEINKWIKGQQESSKTKYEEFHKQQLIAMFDSWYKH